MPFTMPARRALPVQTALSRPSLPPHQVELTASGEPPEPRLSLKSISVTFPKMLADSVGRCNIIYSNRYLEGGVYETVRTCGAEFDRESGYVVSLASRLPREGDRPSLRARSRIDPWSVGAARRNCAKRSHSRKFGADADRARGHISRDRRWRIRSFDSCTDWPSCIDR